MPLGQNCVSLGRESECPSGRILSRSGNQVPLGQDCVSLGQESGCPSGRVECCVSQTVRSCVPQSGEEVSVAKNAPPRAEWLCHRCCVTPIASRAVCLF